MVASRWRRFPGGCAGGPLSLLPTRWIRSGQWCLGNQPMQLVPTSNYPDWILKDARRCCLGIRCEPEACFPSSRLGNALEVCEPLVTGGYDQHAKRTAVISLCVFTRTVICLIEGNFS